MRPESNRPRLLIAQLADIGDLALTTPALAALREACPRARIDLLAYEHALPVVPTELIDVLIPLVRGASGGRAFYAPANLRTVLSLRRRHYDTLVIFHHFTLRAGVFKFWLIAKASGAKRIVGLKNENIGISYGLNRRWRIRRAAPGAVLARAGRPAGREPRAAPSASPARAPQRPRQAPVKRQAARCLAHRQRWLQQRSALVGGEVRGGGAGTARKPRGRNCIGWHKTKTRRALLTRMRKICWGGRRCRNWPM